MEGLLCISFSIAVFLFSATKLVSSNVNTERSREQEGNETLLYLKNAPHDKKGIKNDYLAVMNVMFADRMVSVDCLRCLCLKQSNCKPVGCQMKYSLLSCGYFQITNAIWIDCGRLGDDWKKCANDVMCSSLCIQNYMKRYAERYNCPLKCEGYTRELLGGPNGCNNPVTLISWEAVQKVPGCKGVE